MAQSIKIIKAIKKPIPSTFIFLTKQNVKQVQEHVSQHFGHKTKLTKKGLLLPTLEGPVLCTFGNYIVIGPENDIYPLKKEIFEEYYKIV